MSKTKQLNCVRELLCHVLAARYGYGDTCLASNADITDMLLSLITEIQSEDYERVQGKLWRGHYIKKWLTDDPTLRQVDDIIEKHNQVNDEGAVDNG